MRTQWFTPRRLLSYCVTSLGILAAWKEAGAQVTPDESLAQITVPEGLELSVWAAVPMLANPTAIDVDSRGRVWVAEGLNYRFFRNGDFKRQEKADRIKILEDTDGDGKADKVTIFADDIYPVPMGLAIEEIWKDGKYQGVRVFTGNSPDLLVLEDLDGDDVAEKRYPLLTGFGGVDHDHGVHGMCLGPDGRLYFTQGDGEYAGKDPRKAPGRITGSIRDRNGRLLQNTRYGATYRVNRDGSGLELLANGLRNNYEACVDAFGNVFVSDNDDDGNMGSRMVWIMDGGDYGYRLTGRHWAEEIPGVIPKLVGTGNGSPCGILIVECNALGKNYNGAVLQIDAGTHQINAHPLTRAGAAFRTEYDVFLKGDDSYFRPIDAAFASDGSLLVCDWYDAGVGGHRFTDQNTGRILMFSRKEGNTTPALDLTSPEGQLAALSSPNVSTRFVARQALLRGGDRARQTLRAALQSQDALLRARCLAILTDFPNGNQEDLIPALTDNDPRVRECALRLLTRDCRSQAVVDSREAAPPSRALGVLPSIAVLADDPDAGVRRELLLALRNVPTENCKELLLKLARSWDGVDRYYLEALRLAYRGRESAVVTELFEKFLTETETTVNGSIPLPPYFPTATNDAFLRPTDTFPRADAASKVIGMAWSFERVEALEGLEKLLAHEPSPSHQDGVLLAATRIAEPQVAFFLAAWLQATPDVDRKRSLLRTLGEGLSGRWQAARDDERVLAVFAKSLDKPELAVTAIQALAIAKLPQFHDRLVQLAESEAVDPALRIAALNALAQQGADETMAIGSEWLTHAKEKEQSDPLATAALSAIVRKDRGKSLEILLAVAMDEGYALDLKRKSLALLAADTPGALQLLGLCDKEKLAEPLVLEAAFLLQNHPDPMVRKIAARKLALASMAGGTKITDLDAVLARPKDIKRGKEVFHRDASDACARCHRVQGIGNWVGPDLSSIGTKYGEKELLYHILNPSGAIGDTYVPFSFALTDGTVLTGLVTDEDEKRVVLKTAAGERMVLSMDDIEDRKPISQSIMPENLAQNLDEEQLANLVGYLASLRQPVSEVGEYFVLGPLASGTWSPERPIRVESTLAGGQRWRRTQTSRDQYLDLSSLLGSMAGQEAVAYIPIDAEQEQEAQVALTTDSPVSLYLNGVKIPLTPPTKNVRAGSLTLRKGENDLVIVLSSGQINTGLITTLIADRPLRIAMDRTNQANADR